MALGGIVSATACLPFVYLSCACVFAFHWKYPAAMQNVCWVVSKPWKKKSSTKGREGKRKEAQKQTAGFFSITQQLKGVFLFMVCDVTKQK